MGRLGNPPFPSETLPKTALKSAAIPRVAFEYQDLVGIEVLISFYRDPNRYRWVEVESEDKSAGYLDDVVAARTDGKFEYTQVKFTTDPDTYALSWEWLLERRPRGSSRLKKWADTVSVFLQANSLHRAELRTNRRPDPIFAKALVGDQIKLDRIGTPQRRLIELELGGPKQAKAFFAAFSFRHSEEVDADGLEQRLKGTVVPTDTTSGGWLLLRQQVRKWATHKRQPEPDGKIRHEHLVQIITKKRPKPIPQDFAIPDVFVVPSTDFHQRFLKRIVAGRSSISILWGTPGRGKSTYLSYVVGELSRQKLPVIRHHYFLSFDDTTTDRISFSDIALSLMSQIASRYPEAAEQRGLEWSSNLLRRWIEKCGEYYAQQNKRFYVVVDGLDHVWRERMNIEQMDHLFSYLLPCPKNVVLIVGTQRVADNQLPSRLLTQATPSTWIDVPPMDERAVQDWLKGQDKAGRLRLGERRRDKARRKEAFDAISSAFFQISKGHPLHLIYSFEALVRRGSTVTADEVKLLPRCPDGDIRKYYRSLWGRLGPHGKKVLHLIAGSEFRWPADGLLRCGGNLDEVDHLLDHRRTGVVPFHGSILAYAREQSDHVTTYGALLPRVIRWLEREAPEFWKWGWLWIAKARNEQPTDLLRNTTRQWAIESLAEGWPDNQIVAILKEAEKAAFAKGDYCRTIEIRGLKVRMQNGPEFQIQRYSQFVEAALRSSNNKQQLLNMADEIGSLPDEQIVTLSRPLTEGLVDEVRTECESELRRRVNLWLALRHRPSSEFLSLVRHWFDVLAEMNELDAVSVLKFIDGFRDGHGVYLSLLDALTQAGRLDGLAALLAALKSPKHLPWRRWTEEALVRVACLNDADLEAVLPADRAIESPVTGCYLIFRGKHCSASLSFKFDRTLLSRERQEYGPNPALEGFFRDVFFHSLAVCKECTGEFSFVLPGVDESSIGWMKGAIEALRAMARDLAAGRLQPTFSTPFLESQRLSPVTGRRTTEADSTQYWSYKAALRHIAVDLHLIATSTVDDRLISADEFFAARETRHWEDAAWLSENLKTRFVLLSHAAAQGFRDSLAEKEGRTVTQFSERAERWFELALFSLLYGLSGSTSLVRRAADCLLAYGSHKDPYVFEVLASIQLVQEATGKAFPLLQKVAPIVDQIMKITDGDDIGSSRSELIELVGEICPEKLPDCYAYHIRADRLGLAEEALAAHAKLLDYTDSANQALARTFLSWHEVEVLSEMSKAGRAGAADAFAAQERFLGGVPVSHDHSYGNTESEVARKGKAPDVGKFAPSKFAQLVRSLSGPGLGYEHRDEALSEWISYWKSHGKGREALRAIDKFFKERESTYEAEHVLDDAFRASLAVQGKAEAYKWLVRAHIVRHGWQSHWTSSKEVIRRLEWAATYYRDRWRDFVRDTSKPEPFWERRDYGFSIGLKYLVRFLILVGQKELAARYTATLVESFVKEVEDQPIPESTWLQ